MKYIRGMVLIAILCVATGGAFGQDNPRRDGNWWRGMTPASQVTYLLGFLDGIILGHQFSYWPLKNGSEDGSVTKRVRESFDEYVAKYLENVTAGQLRDGLEVFYEDFRNRRILVGDAVWLVANQIAGVPEEKIDSMIENWRRNSGSH